ncbi:hypothetical protein ACIQRE_00160 [Streptomyces griseoluteus]|uniref:hypothetical protein n=1 Tax=Streptomyces griseoluteus TaxID=29306 RepID=UPI00382D1543
MIDMSTSDVPRRSLPAGARAAVSLLNDPGIVAALESARRLADIAAPVLQMQRDWNRYARDVLGPALEAQRVFAQMAAQPWVSELQAACASSLQQRSSIADAVARVSLSLDTSGLQGVLRDLQAWQALAEEQRVAAVSLLEDAYAATSEADVPGDLVDILEADFLPIGIDRRTFVWSVGIVVFLLMMQLALTSDAAAELMSEAGTIAPMAGAVMVAAGILWDRKRGTTSGDDQDS